ncbi:hypothetical protein Dsin_022251 [Dipteronia sinensis]|uniref:Pentatricopeptide repeat-containing protein n=1 Tax=Dipteronia sinensis TaxID=43782 RepID=A0AAE0DZR8_9ROSI|nr:hypothetical protein Dsin_022251 [Dipteronia sinensis]
METVQFQFPYLQSKIQTSKTQYRESMSALPQTTTTTATTTTTILTSLSTRNNSLRKLSRGNQPENALAMFVKLRMEGLDVDRFSFPPLLKAAARIKGLCEGMQFHGLGAKLGFDLDPFVQTGLVRMYAACGRIGDARLMFDKMSHRDVVTWSIMFDGYCQSGHFDDVLKLFEEMRRSNVVPDEMVLSKILSACARSGNISYGKVIHEFIVDNNVVRDAHLQTALITMYASCGCLDMAKDFLNP